MQLRKLQILKQVQISQLHRREEVDMIPRQVGYKNCGQRLSLLTDLTVGLASHPIALYRRSRLLPALHTDRLNFIPRSDCDIISRKQLYQFTTRAVRLDADKLV